METILVASDFSERSDRALARAALICARSGARMHLVHVVDDDQKQKIIDSEIAASHQLLQEDAKRLKDTDGLSCTTEVVLGDPFEGIITAADAINPDLVVLGAHRRRLLRDVFIGTTAQRTIRRTRWPVLMVNAPPEQNYTTVMMATDLSEISRLAIERLSAMDLGHRQNVKLLHVFDAPAKQLFMRDTITKPQREVYLRALKIEAEQAFSAFSATLAPGGYDRLLRHCDTTISAAVLETASQTLVDLIVVASQGRVDLRKTFLGSVAEEILRRADRDVLVIPPVSQA